MLQNSPLLERNRNEIVRKQTCLGDMGSPKRFKSCDTENTTTDRTYPNNNDKLPPVPEKSVDRNHPIIRFKYDLKSVLTTSNNDVKKWLNLDYIPHCLLNFDKCVAQHGRQANFYTNFDSHINSMLLVYFRNGEYNNACKYLRFCIADKMKIPNEVVLSEVFQLILNINDTPDEPVTQTILELIEDCFSTMMTLHPPHAYYMRTYYKKLLTMPILNCRHLNPGNYESFSGIFLYCINRLDVEMSEQCPEGPIICKNNNLPGQRLKLCLEMNSVVINCNYDMLDRKERISRLLMLLKMFVSLFEQDLAFRIIMYNKESKNSARKLIISHIIWQQTDALNLGSMRPCIRKIIKLFIMSVRTKRSKLDSEILARLLGVVVHAIHLSAMNRRRIFYNISAELNAIAIDISVAIRSEDVDTVITALQFLRPCFIKHLVSNNILNILLRTSANSAFRPQSLNYQEIFVKHLWNQFPYKRPITSNKVSQTLFSDEITIQLKGLICVKDCIAILYEAVLAFIETYELKRINQHNVVDVLSFFGHTESENNNSQSVKFTAYDSIQSSPEIWEGELIQFKEIFEKHFDIEKRNIANVDVQGLDYSVAFATVMQTKCLTQNLEFEQNFSYIPIVSWVTGRNYYRKCTLYLDITKLVNELKIKEPRLFKKFIL